MAPHNLDQIMTGTIWVIFEDHDYEGSCYMDICASEALAQESPLE